MQPIHITYLIGGLAIGQYNGGGELFALRLAQALDPARYKVSICVLWNYDTPVERAWQRRLEQRQITVAYAAPFRMPFRYAYLHSLARVLPILKRLQPDILHTHVEYADLLGVIARLMNRTPRLLRTCHNGSEWPLQPWMNHMTASLFPIMVDAEVGVSPTITRQLNQRPLARLFKQQARYISPTIDIEETLAQRHGVNLRTLLGISASTALFGSVGRLTQQKGYDTLIRAMVLVRATLPDAHLVLVGDGEDRASLEALVTASGLAGCVTFLGVRTDAIALMNQFDLFVSASRWEGLPAVILEAMVLETPLVATDIPGNRDLVTDQMTGRLATLDDPAHLAAMMIQAYQQPQQTRQYALQARTYVAAYGTQIIAAQYQEIYDSLCLPPKARQQPRERP